jgi:primosomal protein N' (replication factor Y)
MPNAIYLLIKPFYNCGPLWYQYDQELTLGSIVAINLRNKSTFGIVVTLNKSYPLDKVCQIKSIDYVIKINDQKFLSYINKICQLYQTLPEIILNNIAYFFLNPKAEPLTPFASIPEFKNILSPKQQDIGDQIIKSFDQNDFQPHLLHGVTGSGKTEIYKYVINNVLQKNKSVIFTAPEISIASQLVKSLKKTATERVFCLHSGITAKQRAKIVQALHQNEAIVIIGIHLPPLIPIGNLGLIIVDEEHESGYQEKKAPHTNSKDCLLIRAQHYKIPIILGSATPSVNSYHLFNRNNWPIYYLEERYTSELANIKLVYFKYDKKRDSFWITSNLAKAISEKLAKKEQVIIFINRRGYSFFLRCEQCQEIPNCKSCSVSLTPHEDGLMHCHYCGYAGKILSTCNSCKNEVNFLHKGIGTQQIVQILKNLFPTANIARADLDITKSKKRWEETVTQMHNGEIDILVGTQTIAKGLHFPNVTLVGVIWADLNLNLPNYNCQEKTLQQLLQVSGRSGRSNHGEVIIQAMQHANVFDYLDEKKYLDFIKTELEKRYLAQYPPYCRFIKIELKGKSQKNVAFEAKTLANYLSKLTTNQNLQVYGPVTPCIEKIEGIFVQQIYVKSQNLPLVCLQYKTILEQAKFKSSISFNPNPLD